MNITLEEIGIFLTFLVTLISSIEFLSKRLKGQVDKTLDPINENMKELDISQCKNFLVNFLSDIENAEEIDEIQKQRAYEIYDHYTNDLNQNSYIHKRWEELMKGNKNEK